jgi:hypothetical protein
VQWPIADQALAPWKRDAALRCHDPAGPGSPHFRRRFRIVLMEGKNRQIRRMVEKVGNRVVRLHRIRVADLKLGNLAKGSWRHLTRGNPTAGSFCYIATESIIVEIRHQVYALLRRSHLSSPQRGPFPAVQATVGCPHNRCTFCMVYKNGPDTGCGRWPISSPIWMRPGHHGSGVRTLFFPAGNTIAMPTDALCRICAHAHRIFPHLERASPYTAPASTFTKRALMI